MRLSLEVARYPIFLVKEVFEYLEAFDKHKLTIKSSHRSVNLIYRRNLKRVSGTAFGAKM